MRASLEIARKIGRVAVELNINAYQATVSNHLPVRIENKAYTEHKNLILEVIDQGPGYRENAIPGFGLQNIRDVLTFLGGDLHLPFEESTQEQGTIARVIIPLHKIVVDEYTNS